MAVVTILGIGMLSTQASLSSPIPEEESSNENSFANSNLTSTTTNNTVPDTTTVDVVVMGCAPNGEGTPVHTSVQVIASSSSDNAPVVESGTDCAQALSDLLSARFFIVDVQPSIVNGAGAYYTLLRTPGVPAFS